MQIQRKEEMHIEVRLLTKEQFGPLYPLVQNERITDINWNGRQLWIDHLDRGRYCSNIILETAFIEQFTSHVSNVVSLNFNKHMPLLEAEANGLRISIIHEAYARSGRSISIRKSPPIKRLYDETMLKENYCTQEILNFLKNCIRAHMNIVICGQVGSGKTELLKYLTEYIPSGERVITIEDNLEIHYSTIHPDKDCIEIKVDPDHFSYTQAIKACLRQLPNWILLSESRGDEVRYLMESLTTGHYCLTTIHTDDVRKIPERIRNMITDSYAAERIGKEAYIFLDICILLRKKMDQNGNIHRYIDQIGCFSSQNDGRNQTISLLVEDGKLVSKNLPEDVAEKFQKQAIDHPFIKWEGEVINEEDTMAIH
jgi:pilus assembly protein CpaF